MRREKDRGKREEGGKGGRREKKRDLRRSCCGREALMQGAEMLEIEVQETSASETKRERGTQMEKSSGCKMFISNFHVACGQHHLIE